MKFWDNYIDLYLSKHADPGVEDGLPFLRNRLFVSVLLITLPISILAYIPGVIVSLETDKSVIAWSDTFALAALLFTFLNGKISLDIKKIIFTAAFYFLAIILLFYIGFIGPGTVILIYISVLTTLIYSQKAGSITVALNAVIMLFFLSAFPITSSDIKFFQNIGIYAFFGIGANLIAFNALIVYSVAFLVYRLNKSFLMEKELQKQLVKESENLLAAKLKAEESDRLKSAFLNNISHEIRTPMNGILGFSELLKNAQAGEADQQKFLDLIHQSGRRMLNVMDEIVAISKIDSGVLEIFLTRRNIYQEITAVYNHFRNEASGKELTFTTTIMLPEAEATIRTDWEKIHIILTSLINNAIKYTDHGSIEIGCKRGVDVQGMYSEEIPINPSDIVLYVKDSGIGIPSDRQEAIFERFIQSDIQDKQARQGAGLGLSIAKSFIEMLGGKIWVDSCPAAGSTFFFTLKDVKTTT